MEELFRKYLDNQCSPNEVNELLDYFNRPENEVQLRGLISDSLEFNDADEGSSNWQNATDNILGQIKIQIKPEEGKIFPFFRRNWLRIAAAAIILAGGFTIYKFMNTTDTVKQQVAEKNIAVSDKGPGGNKAILTLDNGSTINLETALNETLAKQGNSSLIKRADGELLYKSLNEKPAQILFNSVSTPRGGQYKLTLSDGTLIWLNSASSIHFPVAFAGSERSVEITGEVYFEVAKNAAMPFKVKVAGKEEVEVLGTHFDINAYADEPTINTTLLEGSVKITSSKHNNSRIIVPGEQAQLNADDQIKVDKKANAEQVIAWKNGTFNFENANLEMALRQLARWYDVDIVFEDAIPQKQFNGEIQRSLNLSQVLRLLEKNGVNCRIDGKKLIVVK